MWARVPTAIVGGVITVAASRGAAEWGAGNLQYVWAALVFAVLGLATLYIAFFHRKTGDVLIDTESEMRKVVWPSREEVTGSTIVVIGTTMMLGLSFFVLDIGLAQFLSLIGLY